MTASFLVTGASKGQLRRCPRIQRLFVAVTNDQAIKWQAKYVGEYHYSWHGGDKRLLSVDSTAHRVLDQILSLCEMNQVLLLQLYGSDGSASHSVCVVRSHKVSPKAQPTPNRRPTHHPTSLSAPTRTTQVAYLIDSTEPFGMTLSVESLSRAVQSACCIGWRSAFLFTASPSLANSKQRLRRCMLD